MNFLDDIQGIKSDLIRVFGEEDAICRAIELRIFYLDIAREFEKLRATESYETAIFTVCEQQNITESTLKRAISFKKTIVQNFGLKTTEPFF